MNKNKRKLVIGFITYGKNTARYLPYFLPSLKNSIFKGFKIIAIDNTEEPGSDNIEYINKNYPEIDIEWAGGNIGFARAYNKMINKAMGEGAEYFLALNPDMIVDTRMIENLLKTVKSDKKIGAVQPKILRWDFARLGKTNIIDSLGVSLTRGHYFFDKDQGRIDKGDIKIEEIFGFTGAAALLRVDALRDTSFGNEYFDELMFMYKEDCELSYRLRLAGWKIMLDSSAIAYHDRTIGIVGKNIFCIIKNRKSKSEAVKKWSFLNQRIILAKYKNLPYSFSVKLAIAWVKLKNFIFVLLFEKYLLTEYSKLRKIKKEIKAKRKALKIRVNVKEIEKFMK